MSNNFYENAELKYYQNLLQRCIDQGIEIMKINISENIYSIWIKLTKNVLNELSIKMNDFDLNKKFDFELNNGRYYWEKISYGVKFLISIMEKTTTFFLKNTYLPYYNLNSYGHNYNNNLGSNYNPFLKISEDYKPYLDVMPKNNHKNVYDILTNDKQLINTVSQATDLLVSIAQSYDTKYNKNVLLSMPISTVKMIADISINIIFEEIKDSYLEKDSKKVLPQIGFEILKELSKSKINNLIDQIYANRRL